MELNGIVIRQTKTTGARRMLRIFTREEGVVSAGAYVSERGKGDAALAARPFTLGRFQAREGAGGILSVTRAETVDAHVRLGEDIDRYAAAGFALELTDRLLPERVRAEWLFDLLVGYLALISDRKSDFRLPAIAYAIKAMQGLGVFPEAEEAPAELRMRANDDIFNCTLFLMKNPLERVRTLTLGAGTEYAVFASLMRFAREHFDIGALKSEAMLMRDAQGIGSA